ncbi:MAG: sigma-70 family RNA polymerase sigma factor [Bacteroidota bacterium]
MSHSSTPAHFLPDTQLWNQLREGQQSAYLAIYEQFSDILYQYGAKFTSDRELLLDCLHDLFLDLWDRRQYLGPTDSIKFYLFRALRRRIACSLNKPVSRQEYRNMELVDSSEFRWVTEEAAHESKNHLQKAIASLPERQREVIYLRYYNSFSFEEIAGIMKIDIRSAQNLTYKALAKLRVALSTKQQLMLGAMLSILGFLFLNFL